MLFVFFHLSLKKYSLKWHASVDRTYKQLTSYICNRNQFLFQITNSLSRRFYLQSRRLLVVQYTISQVTDTLKNLSDLIPVWWSEVLRVHNQQGQANAIEVHWNRQKLRRVFFWHCAVKIMKQFSPLSSRVWTLRQNCKLLLIFEGRLMCLSA
jgi:hypothetical protein